MAGFLAVEFRQRASTELQSAPPASLNAKTASPKSNNGIISLQENNADAAKANHNRGKTTRETNHVYENDSLCFDNNVWVTKL